MSEEEEASQDHQRESERAQQQSQHLQEIIRGQEDYIDLFEKYKQLEAQIDLQNKILGQRQEKIRLLEQQIKLYEHYKQASLGKQQWISGKGIAYMNANEDEAYLLELTAQLRREEQTIAALSQLPLPAPPAPVSLSSLPPPLAPLAPVHRPAPTTVAPGKMRFFSAWWMKAIILPALALLLIGGAIIGALLSRIPSSKQGPGFQTGIPTPSQTSVLFQPADLTPSPTLAMPHTNLEGKIRTFPLSFPSSPSDIIAGLDGNVWFLDYGNSRIGQITPQGNITEFPLSNAQHSLASIIQAPDGTIWFTDIAAGMIGELNPSNGNISEYPFSVTPESQDFGLTIGPDHNLWFLVGSLFGDPERMNLTTHVITAFPSLFQGKQITALTAGPDGNLWFIDAQNSQLDRLVLSTSVITTFAIPRPALDTDYGSGIFITGPDGNLWFTDPHNNRIGRLVLSTGVVTTFSIPMPSSGVSDIITGPDGNLWFTESVTNKIGRITPAGTITEFSLPLDDLNPHTVTVGPDGNLWFTEFHGNKIGRITPAGTLTDFPLPAAMTEPLNIIAGPDGHLWFTEIDPPLIGEIS